MWYFFWRMEETKKRRGRKAKYTYVSLEDLNKFFNSDTVFEVGPDTITVYKLLRHQTLNKKTYTDKGFKPYPDLNDLNEFLKENSPIQVATSFLEQYDTGLVQKKVDEPVKGEYSLDVIKKQDDSEEERPAPFVAEEF